MNIYCFVHHHQIHYHHNDYGDHNEFDNLFSANSQKASMNDSPRLCFVISEMKVKTIW